MKEGLIKQVNKTISQHNLLKKDENVLIALSGGADSVALLRVLLHLGYEVIALHCNFHLRGEESDRDEQFVKELCTSLQIQLYTKDFDTQQYCTDHKISVEMGARDLRYSWFEEMRKELHAQGTCVAHHRQDQAETILINLLRGTGLRGLAGMHYQTGHIIRPLLDCDKETITEYLCNLQQEWVNDSTNEERDAIRNRIRLDILPLLKAINPQAIKNIAKAAVHIQEVIPIYERGLLKNKYTTVTELYEFIRKYGFNSHQAEEIWNAQNGTIIVSRTHRLLKHDNEYYLQAIDDETKKPDLHSQVIRRELLTEYDKECAYFDSQLVPQPLNVRLIQTGDRFIPFGMHGSKLISDYLTDIKVNRFEKEKQHVLCDAEGNIIWVIGRRTSNKYRITDKTEEVLIISQRKPQIE